MPRGVNSSRSHRRRRAYVQRALEGLSLVLLHELDALSGHVAEVRERLAVARKSRDLAELVRDQVDLLPETRARLHLDRRERRALINSWFRDLRAA